MAFSAAAGYGAGRPGPPLREELTLKYSYSGIIVVLIVVAAMASGCTSGPASSPAPMTKPSGNAAAGPTAVPGMARSGSLFDMGRMQWFEYKLTTQGEDGKGSMPDLRFDYTTAAVNGVMVKDDRITMKVTDPDMVLIMDTYYDQATGRQVGGRMKMVSDDIKLTGKDVAAAGDRCRNSDIAGAFAAGDWPLASQGTESITIDGKTYACTKYSVGNGGEYGTAWMVQSVPVPVKIESISAGEGTSTWELIGWG